MTQAITVAGSPSQSTGWNPTHPKSIPITWLTVPVGVPENISFHINPTTIPLVICGRKKSVRKKIFPRGTSESSSARTIGAKNPKTKLQNTKRSVVQA